MGENQAQAKENNEMGKTVVVNSSHFCSFCRELMLVVFCRCFGKKSEAFLDAMTHVLLLITPLLNFSTSISFNYMLFTLGLENKRSNLSQFTLSQTSACPSLL